MLEFIATWLRACTEYQLEQIAVNTDELGWSTMAVTVQELRPGDLIEELTQVGGHELASRVVVLVTEHGVREGLRLLGVNDRCRSAHPTRRRVQCVSSLGAWSLPKLCP